jgi:tetratricopeptide (TPR) repeat protein
LQSKLLEGELPEKELWLSVFMESWHWVRDNTEEAQDFFNLEEQQAIEGLEKLADAVYDVCVRHKPTFQKAVMKKFDDLVGDVDEIKEYAREILQTVKKKEPKKIESVWPNVSLPISGPKISVPFAGREDELKELKEAMSGKKTIVAIVGMAGQGKSCLAGEWYKRRARLPKGVGLFWRKLYEPGYTFDIFLDDLYFYLTGEHINRQEFTSVEARCEIVQALLTRKPCWLILDGAERWLKRWSVEPDAQVQQPTVDDKTAAEPALDKFLKRACVWENGSKILLTTRVVPSALDENPPVMIGQKHGHQKRLVDLKADDAVTLLKELDVEGDKSIMQQAVKTYGYHPYAVHVLGVLIRDLYDADISRWEEVNPLEEPKLEGLFDAILEHRPEDVPLLELVASSVGPAPVSMLAELLGQDEKAVRRNLARLAKWQMAEFEHDQADQHTVVRQFLTQRMGQEKTNALRRRIAVWWIERKVPDNPLNIDEIQPLLKAIEHLLAAGDPNAAMNIFYTRWSKESHYILNEWLDRFGYIDGSIRINSDLIRIFEQLVEKEGRLELRKDLAGCYNNRGNALGDKGKLDDAIEDYGRAIEIRKQLVEKEGRLELRSDFESILFNRAVARGQKEQWKEAGVDIEIGAELLRALITEGQRHQLQSFMQTVAFACAHSEKMHIGGKAAMWANNAMTWFLEEVKQGRANEVLLRSTAGFAQALYDNGKLLVKSGLDENLLGKFLETLTAIIDHLKKQG